MTEAQSGARLKYSVTRLCFPADGHGPEVTDGLKTGLILDLTASPLRGDS